MKLNDIIKNIHDIHEELIIFQEDRNDYKSDVILSHNIKDGENVLSENNNKYYYLIEVFLAKEFVDDWVKSLGYTPDADKISKRLYEYATNDA
jgi:hypothetical protein